MRRQILLSSWPILFILSLAAGSSQLTLTLSPSAKVSDMAAPVEIISGASVKSGEVLQAVASGASDQSFLLQDAPALFQSSDGVELKRGLCALLPSGVAPGPRQLKTFKPTGALFKFALLEGGRLQLLDGDRPVFVYNYGMQLPPGAPEDRRRSTYIHPLYDLDGRILTDDFPADHYHHRGLSWMWPRVTVAGQQVDLWHIRGIRHSFERWLAQEVGPVCATLGAKNAWIMGERKVMDEWVWVRVFPASKQGRAIDLRLTWRALEPIQILGQVDSGYGGLALRLTGRKETRLVTSTGPQTKDSDLQPMAWADESGKFGGHNEHSGVAIFQHPGNPNFPAGWTLRRADNYGFLGVAWPGLTPVVLEPNQTITLRYRLWVHRGDAQVGRVADAFAAFSEPPSLRLERAKE